MYFHRKSLIKDVKLSCPPKTHFAMGCIRQEAFKTGAFAYVQHVRERESMKGQSVWGCQNVSRWFNNCCSMVASSS